MANMPLATVPPPGVCWMPCCEAGDGGGAAFLCPPDGPGASFFVPVSQGRSISNGLSLVNRDSSSTARANSSVVVSHGNPSGS